MIDKSCRLIAYELFSYPVNTEVVIDNLLFSEPEEIRTVAGEMSERIVNLALSKFNKEVKETTLEFIASEEFIDAIVKRINLKQDTVDWGL